MYLDFEHLNYKVVTEKWQPPFVFFLRKFLSQRGFDIKRASHFVNFFGIGDATIFYRPAKFPITFTEINIREFIFKTRALDFSFEITHDIFSPIYNGESVATCAANLYALINVSSKAAMLFASAFSSSELRISFN